MSLSGVLIITLGASLYPVALFPPSLRVGGDHGFLPPAEMDPQIPNAINPNNLLENINRS
jgi:hypothetical protein